MSQLLDTITDSLAPDALRRLASNLSESPESIRKGLQSAAASLMGALAAKTNEQSIMAQTLGLIHGAGSSDIGTNPGESGDSSIANREAISNLISQLFGANRPAVESKIAQESGLKASSGSTILTTAAPLVIGSLALQMANREGSAGLRSLLASEVPRLSGFIPQGLPGGTWSNLSGAATASASDPTGPASFVRQTVPKEIEKPGDSWLWPVLLMGALLIGTLVWYFHRVPTP